MRSHICGIAALMVISALGGCGKDVPIALELPKKPKECSARHASDLPPVAVLKGPTATTDEVNRHWAKAHRLVSRPAYRSLYRHYKICSRYVQGL